MKLLTTLISICLKKKAPNNKLTGGSRKRDSRKLTPAKSSSGKPEEVAVWGTVERPRRLLFRVPAKRRLCTTKTQFSEYHLALIISAIQAAL